MDARRLRVISQLPNAERFSVLGEGLELLADNVATLQRDARTLNTSGGYRGAAILQCFADEEAAKVMILLDLARAGWKDHAIVKRCMTNFYQHLARGLYVRAYRGSPADLAEVREYVDGLRRQYYLDGPMEVDWIFGNEITTDREERLYVDYVVDENEEGRWTGPADRLAYGDEAYFSATPPSTISALTTAMHQIGLLSEAGLNATREVWDGAMADDAMRWTELRQINVAVINKLGSARRKYTDEDAEALRDVANYWSFPLTSLDLTLIEVDRADLENARQTQLAREMGILDGIEGGYDYI